MTAIPSIVQDFAPTSCHAEIVHPDQIRLRYVTRTLFVANPRPLAALVGARDDVLRRIRRIWPPLVHPDQAGLQQIEPGEEPLDPGAVTRPDRDGGLSSVDVDGGSGLVVAGCEALGGDMRH